MLTACSAAWLSILADRNKAVPIGSPLVSVQDISREHWKTYGRNYFSRSALQLIG